MSENQFGATGRRKNAVARVLIKNGEGKIILNGKDIKAYLCRDSIVLHAMKPIEVAELDGKLDVVCKVSGGGLSGQAGAFRHALARALIKYDTELRGLMKKNGLLTRDSRMVERKKYGQVKARKRFQFSKR